ncbi:leukocyte elastase inhibitor-like [Acropora palmata]|uniref:leukocyte elastase inhibitor-like n=1 Tax=Acropora palmata TaxID=6131 RepID=UPI003DA17F53
MADESEGLVKACSLFALDFHKFLMNDATLSSQNLFYSPASLFVALAMTHFGAKGKTAEEMSTILHLSALSPFALNNEMKEFVLTLNTSSDSKTKLLIANKIFLEKSFEVLEAFKSGTREFYDAEVGLVDFKFHAEQARKNINEWVEEKTNHKIKDLILEGMLNAETKLTLVNAIYFKGLWLEPFNKASTFPSDFFVSKEKVIQVPMMYREAHFKFIESEELACQILELPYIGNQLSMVIYLPSENDGLASLEEKINFGNLQKSLADLDGSMPEEIEVYLPKFKMEQRFSLNDVLTGMGAGEMFVGGKADFSGIAHKPLYVSDVVHKAFVEVNEEGTEAAAATGIGMKMLCLKPMFSANHPFLFFIRHRSTGAMLFLGHLLEPRVEA